MKVKGAKNGKESKKQENRDIPIPAIPVWAFPNRVIDGSCDGALVEKLYLCGFTPFPRR